jgi:hypothetical protein
MSIRLGPIGRLVVVGAALAAGLLLLFGTRSGAVGLTLSLTGSVGASATTTPSPHVYDVHVQPAITMTASGTTLDVDATRLARLPTVADGVAASVRTSIVAAEDVRFYDKYGQPLKIDGTPGPIKSPLTHIPRNPDGSYPTPSGW